LVSRSCIINWLLYYFLIFYFLYYFFFFFFQAEDGIRDYKVTGVQTCALPISSAVMRNARCSLIRAMWCGRPRWARPLWPAEALRSEERRVGKECRSGGGAEH